MFVLFQISFSERKQQLNIPPPVQVKKLDNFVNREVINYISRFVDLSSILLKIMDTASRFNIELIEKDKINEIVNLKKVNDIRDVNRFFETVNKKLYDTGTFIGCVETYEDRFRKIFSKYSRFIAWFIYTLDFLVKRVFPKFSITKKIYLYLTKDTNKALSKVETLGRLVYCGFKIIDFKEISNLLYFVVQKVRQPYFDLNPSYGLVFRMRRIGKEGKIIRVFKLRTMHPYAEYLQKYIYDNYGTETGDKFNNDFRITSWGRIMRKLWLDEFPMLINLLMGDIKLVGVRPLSIHKFNTYPLKLQEKRKKFKPGLVPPFYADMPKSVDEMFASEENYLDAYEKHPWLTDWNYFWKAFYNIVLKKARSC